MNFRVFEKEPSPSVFVPEATIVKYWSMVNASPFDGELFGSETAECFPKSAERLAVFLPVRIATTPVVKSSRVMRMHMNSRFSLI